MTTGEAVRTALGLLLLAGVVLVFVQASHFNGSQMRACEERGMSWVREYPFGDYGCAVVLPVPHHPFFRGSHRNGVALTGIPGDPREDPGRP